MPRPADEEHVHWGNHKKLYTSQMRTCGVLKKIMDIYEMLADPSLETEECK
jgi:hypothetical protein